VPAAAFRERVSAPPKMLRHWIFPYAEPSTFPRSVPVFMERRPRSVARMKTSRSEVVEEGSTREGRSMNKERSSRKISREEL